jgi:succinyl-CoA synthetase beta subunit
MLKETTAILEASRKHGWVLEPDAKRLLAGEGFDVPASEWVRSADEAVSAGEKLGWPVVAKIVSPEVIHKSDAGGVEVGVGGPDEMRKIFERFSSIDGFDGVLVEEMLSGIEVIVGGKIDEQFGPVILTGMGGVGVEIYSDTAIRMAPVEEKSVDSMIDDIKASRLLRGYRGSPGVNIEEFRRIVSRFSKLVTEMADMIESVDLNPVLCSEKRCVVADARIILKKSDN